MWDRKDRAPDRQMECMRHTYGDMNRHREGQKRDRQACPDGWTCRGAKRVHGGTKGQTRRTWMNRWGTEMDRYTGHTDR